ncbi:dipeptide/tripeptide permease, partial [Vibrio metoecus]
ANVAGATESLLVYGDVFAQIGYVTAAIALVTFMIAPKLTRICRGESEQLELATQ